MRNTVLFEKEEKLGELLIKNGKLQPGQLDRALSHLSSVPQGLGEILVSLGFVSEEDLLAALAEQLHFSIYAPDPDDEFLPLEVSQLFHREHPFALIRREDHNILVVNDPQDGDVLSAAEIMISEPFEIQLTTESQIKKMVDDHYGLAIEEGGSEQLIDVADIDKLKDMASEAPVIKYVNNLIDTAVTRRASDI